VVDLTNRSWRIRLNRIFWLKDYLLRMLDYVLLGMDNDHLLGRLLGNSLGRLLWGL
jgi:hypothetical protein